MYTNNQTNKLKSNMKRTVYGTIVYTAKVVAKANGVRNHMPITIQQGINPL